jgi:predicted membrane protein
MWGIFLLLAAALVVVNQVGGFVEIGFWSLAIAALAVAMFISCLVSLSWGTLPIPIAVLYYIFQQDLNESYGFPILGFWSLVLVTLLACAGLSVLLPRRWKRVKFKNTGRRDRGGERPEPGGGETDSDNNPVIDLRFGHVSRYIHADSLERAVLNCQLGAIEVYFDQAQLSPDGAEIICNVQCGAIEMHIPKHWRVDDRINCTLGGVEMSNRRADPDENSPLVTIKGNVSLGGIEINRV